MHRSGPLPLTFEGSKQGFGGKHCQNADQGKLNKTYKQEYAYKLIVCAFSKDSDQPVHLNSLITAFALCSMNSSLLR